MKILFDQGTPVPLKNHLPNHCIETAFERGWSELSNGDLLLAAEEEGFEVMVTTDQNLRYQQNLSERVIAILVLRSASWPKIQTKIPEISLQLDSISTGDYIEIAF